MHRWWGPTVCALFFVGLLGAGIARAADVEEPETLIQQAIELRKKGDNARAYGYLKRAYDLARTPRSAAQLGLVEHALGRYADAEVHLGEALASADPWVDANRPRLESSRSFVRSKLGRVEINGAPADATASVGSEPPVSVPRDRVLYLTPGEHSLKIEAPGLSAVTKTVTVRVGETVTIAVEAAAKDAGRAPATAAAGGAAAPSGAPADARDTTTPAPPVTAERGSGSGLRIAGLGIAGGGLALGVAGIFVRGAATSKLDAIARDARNGVPYNESNGNWQGLDRAGVALIATGGAAVVAGTVLYLVNRTSPESSKVAIAFTPVFDGGGGGGGLTLAGRY